MLKKLVIGVCGLFLVLAFAAPAPADQSIGYQEYYNKGVKAFKEHDDQKALRCFAIAEIYDPSDKDLRSYLSILSQRGVVLVPPPAELHPEQSIGYRYYLSKAFKAFGVHDHKNAIRYFKIARIFNPSSKETLRYLTVLGVPPPKPLPPVQMPVAVLPQQVVPATAAPEVEEQPKEEAQPQPTIEETQVPVSQEAQPIQEAPPVPTTTPTAAQPQSIQSVQPQQVVQNVYNAPAPAAAAAPQAGVIYVPGAKGKQPPMVISLAQLTNNPQIKPKLQIEYHSSVIIEGRNIKRFLIVDESFIKAKILDANHLQIDALAIGTTFIHIWDDFGRHSFYVEVVFPKPTNANNGLVYNGVRHSEPFVFSYANDWNSYYAGPKAHDIKRQSYQFEQSLGVRGETPYGYFDASGSYSDFNSVSEFDTYTVGLSQIPLNGTTNFNLRGFDALRYLSPLTMPTTRLRGAFADVELLDSKLGISVSHGLEQQPLGFVTIGSNPFLHSYIDALKLTLFPRSDSDQYSFNFATAYGDDRPSYLANHVYSVEGQHKFNDYLTFNAEHGSDTQHQSELASLRWQNGGALRSVLGFRNIAKGYSTVSTLPSYQGETGATWTTNADFKNMEADLFLETYRNRLDFNPDNSKGYNYDGNGHLKTYINPSLWNDTDFNFVDTPGQLSPSNSFSLNDRLSQSFGLWNTLRGTVFGGVGYQNSHFSTASSFNFHREDAIVGVQVPLTHQISSYANYEYDWLTQPEAGGKSNPSEINAGLSYEKQLNQKVSFNTQVDYHDELGVKSMNTSFLSGERSVIVTAGFNYNPTPDVNLFGDVSASKVISHIGSAGYDDYEFHLGMRINFGGATYWDPLGTVSGIVFKDRTGSGKFSAGDEGIAGVKVKVGDKETVTDKNGRYRLQVRAKGVDVTPVLDTVPGGLIFSTPQMLNIQIVQGHTAHADFGLISQTGIYGIVFVSKTGAASPGSGDQFIGKVHVILDGKISQKSDSHGAFYFTKVSPGQHTIDIDVNSLPLNMVPLIKLSNAIDVAEGTNYLFNIPVKIEKAQVEEK
jgi:hypothetical protein